MTEQEFLQGSVTMILREQNISEQQTAAVASLVFLITDAVELRRRFWELLIFRCIQDFTRRFSCKAQRIPPFHSLVSSPALRFVVPAFDVCVTAQ